jgi:hypothetical protein
MPKPWWRRRWAKITAAIVLLLVVMLLLAPFAARAIVRAKLQAALSDDLNAQVHLDAVGFWPPYQFSARGLRIAAPDSAGKSVELFNAEQIRISLAQSPWSDGPVVIERLDLKSPNVHLIRTAQGIVGRRFHQPPATPTTVATQPARPTLSFSQRLQIRHANITNASFIFEDQQVPGSRPVQWSNLNLTAGSTAQRPAEYTCQITADDVQSGKMDSSLQVNLDDSDPVVAFEKCLLTVNLDDSQDRSAVPAQMQRLARDYEIRGALSLAMTGRVPLTSRPGLSMFQRLGADVQIKPRGLTIRPRGISDPIQDFGDMRLRIAAGSATIETLRAGCGEDSLLISQAVLSLGDLPNELRVEKAAGCLVLGRQHPQYPSPLAEAFDHADARGPYWFDGSMTVIGLSTPQPMVDYRIHVKTDRGVISSREFHIPMHNVNLDLIITPQDADLAKFAADTLSGKIEGVGHVNWQDELAYRARASIRRVDLNSLAQVAVEPGEKPINVGGELDMNVTLHGEGTRQDALDALEASGDVHVSKGDLFRVPVLKEIADVLDIGGLATASEAMANFTIADRRVRLDNATINSPTLGVSGGGEIGFDGALNLKVIANLLSDLEHRIDKFNNPVADLVGSVAGIFQRGMNRIAETLLYQLHVSGTIEKPQVRIIAAPALRR